MISKRTTMQEIPEELSESGLANVSLKMATVQTKKNQVTKGKESETIKASKVLKF